MSAAALTLGEARPLSEYVEGIPRSLRPAVSSLMMQETVRDLSYQSSPVGAAVGRYLRWKRYEWGAAENTMANRESALYKLGLDYAHFASLRDFEPPVGTETVREFLQQHWGELSAGTRANRTSILRDFFAWAVQNDEIAGDPMLRIATPRQRGRRRDAHAGNEVRRLILAQPRRRDRLALSLLARQAFRKAELGGVQLGHFDFMQRSLSIFGKGSQFAVVALFEDIADEAERYCQERAVLEPVTWTREYLLYPERAIRRGAWPNYWTENAEYRDRPMAHGTLQRWWRGCLERAEIEPFPMHELRHTAATHFHIAQGDYELTRQFLRHKNIATTATYIHVPSPHVAEAMRKVPNVMEEGAE